MAAQSIASRPRRPQQVETDDAVLVRALQFADWARKNVILVSAVGIAVVLVVGGLFWYRADRAQRMEEAAVAFLPVEQAVLAGEETTAVSELQRFIQQHGDTPYGDEARLLLGQVHLRGGRTAEAIEVVQPVAANIDGSPVGAQAGLLLAAAQEAAGQADAAIQTYLRVADEAETEIHREEALSGAALLREQAGDYAGAAELYGRLVEMNADTPDEPLYEMRRVEAETKAATQ